MKRIIKTILLTLLLNTLHMQGVGYTLPSPEERTLQRGIGFSTGFLAARTQDPITKLFAYFWGSVGSCVIYKWYASSVPQPSLSNSFLNFINSASYGEFACRVYTIASPLFDKQTRAESLNHARDFSHQVYGRARSSMHNGYDACCYYAAKMNPFARRPLA